MGVAVYGPAGVAGRTVNGIVNGTENGTENAPCAAGGHGESTTER
ncbi:hypothetical protein [Streptosporangium sp. NPDC051022]